MRSKFANRSRSDATYENLAASEPGKHGLAGEAPLAAELAPGQLARLGELGDRVRLNLQPLGELCDREHVRRGERAELGVAHREPVLDGLDRDAPQRVEVAVAGDETGHEVLLGALESMRGLVQPLRLRGGEAYVER